MHWWHYSYCVRGCHTEMCQFESGEDADYRSLVGEIVTHLDLAQLRWSDLA